MTDSQRKIARAVGVTAFLLISLTTFVSSIFDAGMRCDDTCSPNVGEHWRRYAGSSQWDMIFWLGLGVLGFAIGCWVVSLRGQPAFASVLLGGWALTCVGLATLQDSGEEPWMLLAFVAGVAMIRTARRREPGTPGTPRA